MNKKVICKKHNECTNKECYHIDEHKHEYGCDDDICDMVEEVERNKYMSGCACIVVNPKLPDFLDEGDFNID